ncbi:MAG TPA: four helix bundle protein [Thermoanaerobaculia bacterium]|nr:four helix bundle protein [Thermoanaerobaculia bacterium]
MAKGDDIRERAFRFACEVVELHDVLWPRGGSARVMSAQLLRSGSSIGANLEEADAAQSKPDFVHKCSISLKEARESHYWLRVLAATRKIENDRLVSDCNEIIAILTTIIRKASTS